VCFEVEPLDDTRTSARSAFVIDPLHPGRCGRFAPVAAGEFRSTSLHARAWTHL